MKALFLILLLVVLVGGGLKAAGVRLPIIDHPIGIYDGRGPGMPDVQIEAPEVGGFQAP